MRNFIGLFTLLALACFVMQAEAANAELQSPYIQKVEWKKNRSGTTTDRRGQTNTWQNSTERSRGAVNKNSTWQNSKGGEGSSAYQRTWNKDAGTGQFNRTTTNAQGKTATTNKTYVKNFDGTYSVQGSHSGYGGKTSTSAKTYTKNEDGSYSVNKTVTGENGKSVTSTSNVTKTEGGWQTEGSYATSDGKTGTYSQTGKKTEDGRQVNTSVTNDNGKTWNREADYSRDGQGAYSRNVTETGPNGKTRTWSSGATVDRYNQ